MLDDPTSPTTQPVSGGRPAAGPILDGEIQSALGRLLDDLYRPEPTDLIPTSIQDLLDRLDRATAATTTAVLDPTTFASARETVPAAA